MARERMENSPDKLAMESDAMTGASNHLQMPAQYLQYSGRDAALHHHILVEDVPLELKTTDRTRVKISGYPRGI